MKILILLTLLISINAFAIDFNKVSGSFEGPVDKKNNQVHLTAMADSFQKTKKQIQDRSPANSESQTEKSDLMTESTGSFR